VVTDSDSLVVGIPEPTEEQIEAIDDLSLAIGRCILAWATVEQTMSWLFCWALRAQKDTLAYAIFATPRNFEARSLLVHNAMRVRLENDSMLGDWNLLYTYVMQMSKKRNEVAHATVVGDGSKFELEPYFVQTQTKPRIDVEEVKHRGNAFVELDLALCWFLGQPAESGQPTPDLLLQLRKEDVQRREEQRARQKPS
jgi:hypothetical protein